MTRVLQWTHHPTPSGDFGAYFSLTERYTVELDNPDDALVTFVREFPALQYGSEHPTIAGAFVTRFRPQHRFDTFALYDLEVTYEQTRPQSGRENSQPPGISPWLLAPVIETGSQLKRVTPENDAEGRPMENAAGERIETEFEIHLESIRISRAFRFRPRFPDGFRGAINSDTVMIDGKVYAPETLRIIEATTRSNPPQQFGELPYVDVSITALVNEETWKRSFPNVGYYELALRPRRNRPKNVGLANSVEIRMERIEDANGRAITIPQWLDEHGRRVRDDKGELLLPVPDNKKIYIDRYPGKRMPLANYFR